MFFAEKKSCPAVLHPALLPSIVSLLFVSVLFAGAGGRTVAAADGVHYDVVYLWDDNLNNVLDYKEELGRLLGPDVGRKLKVVGRGGDQFGIVYDRNGSAISSARVAIRHSLILTKADLGDAWAAKDEGHHELFNVCYGLGPNLEALKRQYATIYRFLGAEVGNNLFIEKTDAGNYTLIYRRLGDRESSATVARRHAKLLAGKHLAATIVRENNNEEVFGESSYLDHEAPAAAEPVRPAALAALPARSEPAPVVSPVLVAGNMKTAVASNGADSSRLEQRLEEYVSGLRRSGKVGADERTGWLVIDLTKGETIVDINVDSPYQAASMIKPLLALAFFQRVKEGGLIYGPKSRQEMAAMIQRSSNTATNWVLKQVGGPQAAQRILNRHYGQILRDTSIVEYIPKNGRTYRNRASAKDYGRFLTALWRSQLPYSKELRRLMALPGRDRLYCGTPIPRGTLVYNKTGTTARLCGDMGILAPRARDGRRYPYVLVGIIEKEHKARDYGSWKMARSDVIRQVSTMVYQEMKENYNLL